MAGTILRLGWSDPRTDVFGAHPLLGDVVDLNDGVTFTLLDDALELSPPPREVALAGNARTQGERATRALYRHNRQARAPLILGPMASYSDLIANVRTLVRWIDAAPTTPFCIQWQPPSATAPVYLDVVGAAHALPADERDWLRLQVEPIELVFVVRPGLRGDRLTLSNLVVNPGFEAPSGPGVTVFNDPLTTLNAYTAAGGTLTQDVATYTDQIMTDQPLRYYRLDESGGTTIYDASLNAQHATATASGLTYAQSGLLTGSPDTAVLFNGSSGYLAMPASGFPTGNGAWTIEAWIKLSSTPATPAVIASFGATSGAANTLAALYVDTGGHVVTTSNGSNAISSGVVSLGVAHHVVGVFDGVNLRTYVDGALTATTAATLALPSPAQAANIGAWIAPVQYYFAGTLDEVAIYPAALASTRISAHYTAGHTAPSAVANTLQVPSGASATFGSPTWGSVNVWQVRFRYRTGMTAFFHAHAPDAVDTLGVEIGSNTLYLQQTIAGVQHLLGNASFTTVNEMWYWFQFTQFPSIPGAQCDVQVTLYRDNSGTFGAPQQVATIGPVATYDGVTALSGKAQFTASGAALGLGGSFSGVQSYSLFGPGGWGGAGLNGSPTGVTALAWEQSTANPANTYTGGAVTSFGAARMDLPPAGSVAAFWESYSGGAPLGTSAIPTTTGNGMAASAVVRSTGLSATAALALVLREWDASGTLLRATTLQSVSGNHAAWTSLSGSATIGATTAFCSVQLTVSDATSGASAGGVVWWDNTQCWNVTTTGQSSMPYCELRFPQSPAQLLLTGLQGDLPAPAFLGWGVYLTSWGLGATLTYAIGRRARATANAKLLAASFGFYGTALSPTATAVLDSSSYGGYYNTVLMTSAGWNPRAFSFAPSDHLGVYHVFSRFWSAQTLGNLPNVQTRVLIQQKTGAWLGALDSSDQIGAYYGPYSAPLAASSTWTVVDSGQATIPALPTGALTDLTQSYLTPRSQWYDGTSGGGGAVARCNWQCLVPVDGSLLVGVVNNAANNTFAVTARWLWAYLDGLLLNRAAVGDAAAATYSLESIPTANPAQGGGGPGTQNTGVINLNSGADPCLILDPTLATAAVSTAVGTAAGGAGVNQLVAAVADNAGAVLPVHAEISYSPLYLYPR